MLLKNVVKECLPHRTIHRVPGDGLCTFHAICVEHFDETGVLISLSEIKDSLKARITQWKDFYNEKHDKPWETLLTDLDSPFDNYNSDASDLFLFGMGIIYPVNIIMVETEAKTSRFDDFFKTQEFTKLLYFSRSLFYTHRSDCTR